MKNISTIKHWLGVSLLAVSTASSAGVWEPNDGDINLISINPMGLAFPALNDTFGIFEDSADLNFAAPVLTFDGVGAVSFTPIGADYTISNEGTFGTLLGSNKFQIGFLSQNGWSSEVANMNFGSDANLLIFNDGLSSDNAHFLYAFDITAAASSGPVAAVPLPGAIWFMGSALLGFMVTGRRKALAITA